MVTVDSWASWFYGISQMSGPQFTGNLAMEQQRRPNEKDHMLTLATRNCLFRLLSFLDSRLPDSSAVHSFVHAALITANPSYQVYFRQQRFSTTSPTDLEEDDYSLIIGIRLEHCMDVNQQLKKFWNLTAWTLDNEKHEREMASAFEELNMIDWNLDVFTMRYKHHTPSPAVMNFLIEKQRPGLENKHNIPCNQYYLTKEDALSNIKEIDGVYVKSLERCHAQTVYDHWPYKGHTTLDYVSEEIEQLPSAGVFFKGSDQLVSWMMCSPPNGMSRIFTLEEYRHRGYAALVTKRQDTTNTTSISSDDEEDYSVIVGVAKENYLGSNEEIKKCWTMTAWTDSDENLAGAYEAIDEIDWRDDVIVIHYKHHTLHQGLENFLDRERVQGHCYPCDQYVLPTKDAFNLQIGEIDGVYVKSLERCHAQLVYDQWPYRAGSTVEKVAKEIEELPSAGVFLKDNDKLVSWMMYHLPNGMSRLHTLQEYRRRGYAALVTQYLSKRVAQCGFVPFVNVHLENIASFTLFTSTMGFRRLCYGHCYVTSNYPS